MVNAFVLALLVLILAISVGLRSDWGISVGPDGLLDTLNFRTRRFMLYH